MQYLVSHGEPSGRGQQVWGIAHPPGTPPVEGMHARPRSVNIGLPSVGLPPDGVQLPPIGSETPMSTPKLPSVSEHAPPSHVPHPAAVNDDVQPLQKLPMPVPPSRG